jgi:ABC-type transport system substrate-binding protein
LCTGPINDLKVRQAIDLAIDRTALSQALAGGHGTRSLFPDFTPYYNDDTDGARDRKGAEALLDEAGWVLDEATGVRSKDGQELEVDLVAYAFRPGLGLMQPALAAALEEVGFKVNVIMTRDGAGSGSNLVLGSRRMTWRWTPVSPAPCPQATTTTRATTTTGRR